jgi:prepilin-type N-terminal cleavage/methylation domain-containing protein
VSRGGPDELDILRRMRTRIGLRHQSDRGFTLVELLIVMTILGVLAGIAIPVILSNRGKAYKATMASDLHAAVLAEMTWNAEHETYTTDVLDLTKHGYVMSEDITPVHIVVTGKTFVACLKHTKSSSWLVYDSSSSRTSSSDSDCAA